MKCFQPITIRNKKLAYHSGYDRLKMVVPCGTCLACRENIKNDWILRTYYHWLRFYESKGKVLFVTLTYRPECVPYVHDGEFNFACFNRKDIVRWLNSIRKFFDVHYSIKGIDYIVTCEYGGKKTKRPHYHALLFFPYADNLPNVSYLKRVIEYYWFGPIYRKNSKGKFVPSALVSGTRGRVPKRMGFVYWSKKYGAEVTCAAAAKYVGKYICKDLDFYDKPDIKKYLSFPGKKDLVKDRLPRHWQSHSFGLSLLDYLLSLPYDEQLVAIEKGVAFKATTFRYTLPSYITNRLYYDVKPLKTEIGDKVYFQRVANDRWFQYNLDLKVRARAKVVEQLQLDLSPFGLEKFLPNLQILERYCRSMALPFYEYTDLSNYLVVTYIKPYSFEDLAAYKEVYRGYSYNDSLINVPWLSVEALTKLAPSIQLDRLRFNFAAYDFDPESDVDRSFDRDNQLVKFVPQYSKFEYLLTLLESMKCFTSERAALRIDSDNKKVDKIKKDSLVYYEE